MVEVVDLGGIHKPIESEINHAISGVLKRERYILGCELESFESEFAAYVGARHCVGVGNGLDALRLGLIACGIGPDDEVIVPSNTYIATWLAVTSVGARVVPVEPDMSSYNIDPSLVAEKLNRKTKAIMVVHLYGQPVDMDALQAVSADYDIPIIEDCAQAHGARYKGSHVGTLGRIGCWSFYPSKNLGALGDGGAVTTNDPELAASIRRLRNYGGEEQNVHSSIGFNSRLDEIQAAVLRVKLKWLDRWNGRRSEIAASYAAGLTGLDYVLPTVPDWAMPVWYMYAIRHDRRDPLRHFLSGKGINTLVHYPLPPHLQQAYSFLGLSRGCLPISEEIHRTVLSLPIGPHLETSDTDFIIDTLKQFSA